MASPSLVKTQPYFGGSAAARIDVEGWTLAEVEYAEARECRRHAHRNAFLSMVLTGGYGERFGTRAIQYGPWQIGFHPEATDHVDHIAAPRTRMFIAELESRWLHGVTARTADGPVLCSPRAAWLATTLIEAIRSPGHSRLAIESVLAEILGTIKPSPLVERQRPAWINRVIELIHEEFDERLTIRTLAVMVGRHPVYLSRAFRKFLGMGIGEYLAHVRIDAALRALSERHDSIAAVALDAGFADQSRLTRVLKARTGATPGEIRRTLYRLSCPR